MNPYPIIIKYSDFNVNPVSTESNILPTLHLTKSTNEGSIRNAVSENNCGAAEIKLHRYSTGVESNKFYKSDEQQHPDIPSADPTRYCFAPLKEDVRIHWKHHNPKLIKKSILQLFCHINGNLTPIWTKTFTWDKCPETAKTKFKGSLTLLDEQHDKDRNKGLKSVKLDYDKGQFDAHFPGECVTAEFSPYKLMLTVVPKSTSFRLKPQSVWMYFDVLVHDIEFEWCPTADLDKVLPNTNKARNLAVCQSLADAADNDNLNGAIPTPGQTKKVYLKSHTFYLAASELTDITYYNRYKTLWGDGPVIPIFAKAKIRNSSGEGVDAPLALGKAKFMWDWVDKATDPYNAIGDASIQAWVDTSRNYKAAVTAESPAGKNCHVDRGGKRGIGAKTCFPQQNGKPPADVLPVHDGSDQMFPFDVTPLNGGGSPFATRKWAAYSHSRASGALAGKTGVLFQPSRMGGDGYELHVYLAYDTDAEMETAASGTIRQGLHKNTGTFQIWRELDIIEHIKIGKTASHDLNLAVTKTKFEKYFIKLNTPQTIDSDDNNWFNSLQNVVNGNALPDFIRASVDPTQRGKFITFVDYDNWYNKMLAAHGPDDPNLANWANTINNGPNFYRWELLDGGNGQQPIMKPWLLQFPPNKILNIDGTVRIEFPDLNNVNSLDIKFDRKTLSVERKTTLSPQQRTDLKNKLSDALTQHRNACNGSLFSSYGRGTQAAHHSPLKIQLWGLQDKTRRNDRLDTVRQVLKDLNWEIHKESGKNNYTTCTGYGWAFDISNEIIKSAIPNNQEGFVAFQVTDLCNVKFPTGKAFFSSPPGTFALATTLDANPNQQTFEHELGHALFLGHTYHSEVSQDPNFLHQKDPNSVGKGVCVMHKTPSSAGQADSLFCGFCIVRLWGWSFQLVNALTGAMANPTSRTLWYDPAYNQDPGSPAPIPFLPTDGKKQAIAVTIVGTQQVKRTEPIITGAGTAKVIVTAAGMLNSPKTVFVQLALNDSAENVATKINDALMLDGDINSFFKANPSFNDVGLIAQVPVANDATMNISIDNETCAGLTAVPNAVQKTAGVAPALLHPLPA